MKMDLQCGVRSEEYVDEIVLITKKYAFANWHNMILFASRY